MHPHVNVFPTHWLDSDTEQLGRHRFLFYIANLKLHLPRDFLEFVILLRLDVPPNKRLQKLSM